jgi:D-hydroxyproline dehydrogenase subunit gamma
MARRRNDNVTRGDMVELTVDGQPVSAYKGETLAAVLLLHNKTSFYRTRSDRPRMMFCNMGTCFECRVRVTQAGVSRWVLACVTPVQPRMTVDTDVSLSQWIPGGTDDV